MPPKKTVRGGGSGAPRSPGPVSRGGLSAGKATSSRTSATPSKPKISSAGPSKTPSKGLAKGGPPSPSKAARKRPVQEQAGINTTGPGTQGDELMARKFARSSPVLAPGQSGNDWLTPGEPDPWKGLKSFHGGKISENEEYLKVKKMIQEDGNPEERAVVTLDDIKNMAARGFSSSEEVFDDVVGPEGKAPRAVMVLKDCDLMNVEMTPFMRANLVAMDLSGNQLDNIASLGPCWLRAINGTGNQLTKMPELGMMSKLTIINFSFNDMSATNFAKYDFGPSAGRIREVILDGCSISEICSGGSSPFQQLGQLSVLSLSHNMIADMRQLAFLESMSTLSEISLLDNPVNENAEYPPFMLKMGQKLGSLKFIDKRDVKSSSFKGWNDVDAITEGIKRSKILNASDDNSSCSCIEGNPCLTPESCGDWKNRYEVARKAREAKFWSKNTNFCDL